MLEYITVSCIMLYCIPLCDSEVYHIISYNVFGTCIDSEERVAVCCLRMSEAASTPSTPSSMALPSQKN